MKNFITKNYKYLITALCVLFMAFAGLFVSAFSTAKATDETSNDKIYEIAADKLPGDLRSFDQGSTYAENTYIFFSPDWLDSNYSHIGFEGTSNGGSSSITIYKDNININLMLDVSTVTTVNFTFNMEAGKVYYYKLPVALEVSRIIATFAEPPADSAPFEELIMTNAIQIDDTGTFDPTVTEQPGEDVTGNEDKKTDIGDFFANLGDSISSWIGDNVGLSVSGGAVLVIGGIILLFILFKKK